MMRPAMSARSILVFALAFNLLLIDGFAPLLLQSRRTSILKASPELFPVLRKIQGIDWEGDCRYTGADLIPAPFLLKGGVRYELEGETCTLTSFLTFPNGKTRRVTMSGKRGPLARPSMRLDPVEEEGPIYMVLTELAPDTILLNEVDKETSEIVMTASLNLVNGGSEIVQVSHEVGTAATTPIEGHQVWRLKKATIRYNDFAETSEDELFRDATGR